MLHNRTYRLAKPFLNNHCLYSYVHILTKVLKLLSTLFSSNNFPKLYVQNEEEKTKIQTE